MKELLGLTDKVVVVTGAGKGIGYETAVCFAGLGCKVAAISRTQEDLDLLGDAMNLSDDRFLIQAGDVASPEIAHKFSESVLEKFGHVDVLINNAGIRFRKPFLEISYEDWQHVMATNLGSTFLFCQSFGADMVRRKSGRIINMASVVGTLGLPELVGYGASKGGIISLTKSLAVEWAAQGVNVNVIAPGFCKTSYADNFKKNSGLYDFTIDRTPAARWGDSEDIAKTCVYLASDLSRYVTGEVLSVDGGWSAW